MEEPFPGLESVLKKEPGLKKWVFKNGDQICTHPHHMLIFKKPTKEISSTKIQQKYQEDVFTTQSTCRLYLG